MGKKYLLAGIQLHVLLINKTPINKSINFNRLYFPLQGLDNNKLILKYRMRSIWTRGLYIYYPIFEDHFFVFKEVLSKNSVLIYVSIQERFVIKSGLWWHAYGNHSNICENEHKWDKISTCKLTFPNYKIILSSLF